MNKNAYLDIARASLGRCTGTTNGSAPYRRRSLRSGYRLARRAARPVLRARQMGGWPAARWHRGALQLEQPALRVEAPGVAAERPIARDDPVAGDHDRDRVVPDRAGGGPVGAIVADVVRDLRVGDQLAVGHTRGHREHLSLERRQRREVDRDVEVAAFAAPVLIELARDVVHAPRVGQHARPVGADDASQLQRRRLGAVMDVEQSAWPDRDPEWAERRLDDAVADRFEPFAPCAPYQTFARVRDDYIELAHRIASFTFFIASATRDRAASSLHSSATDISAYDSPWTLRSTNAARCPVGSAFTAVARSASDTPSRSGAASGRSPRRTNRFARLPRSIALFVAIL